MSDLKWWMKTYLKQLKFRYLGANIDRDKERVKEQYSTTGTRDLDLYFDDAPRKRCVVAGKFGTDSSKMIRDFYMDQVANEIQKINPRRVLEVGAGSGLNLYVLSQRFPDIHFEGIDLTPERIEVGKTWFKQHKNFELNSHVGDVTQLTFEDNAFDLIYSIHCFEQLNQYSLAGVKEVCRVAKSRVVFVEPDFVHSNPAQRLFLKNHDYLVDFNKTIESVAPGKLVHSKLDTYYNALNRSGLFVVNLEPNDNTPA